MFPATVHDGYLYTAMLDPFMQSKGTDWYKLDIDTGEVLAKDAIDKLTNLSNDGTLIFEINNGKMLLSDGHSFAITEVE